LIICRGLTLSGHL